MKRGTKGILTACLVLFVLGIVFCAIGAIIGIEEVDITPSWERQLVQMFQGETDNWADLPEDAAILNDDEDTGKVKSKQTVTFDKEEIRSLDVSLDYASFTMKKAESGEEITLTIYCDDQEIYYETEDDGTLQITEDSKDYSVTPKKLKVILSVPADMEFDQVDISTDAGNVILKQTVRANDLSIEVDAGKVTGGELLIADETTLSVDAGKIEFSRIETGSLSMETDMGSQKIAALKISDEASVMCDMGKMDLTIEGKPSDYSYDINCDLGSVKIGDKTYTSLGCEKEINAGKDLPTYELDCSMGTIVVRFQ
jgi:hypothetical protein